VAHTCHSSYLEGADQEDNGLRAAQATNKLGWQHVSVISTTQEAVARRIVLQAC
jgi:hypothetical protein